MRSDVARSSSSSRTPVCYRPTRCSCSPPRPEASPLRERPARPPSPPPAPPAPPAPAVLRRCGRAWASRCWSSWPRCSARCSSCCSVGMSSGSSSCPSSSSCVSSWGTPAPLRPNRSRPNPRANAPPAPRREAGPGPHAKESPLRRPLPRSPAVCPPLPLPPPPHDPPSHPPTNRVLIRRYSPPTPDPSTDLGCTRPSSSSSSSPPRHFKPTRQIARFQREKPSFCHRSTCLILSGAASLVLLSSCSSDERRRAASCPPAAGERGRCTAQRERDALALSLAPAF